MLKLFWAPRTRSSRALWLLEEAGVPFERIEISLADPQGRADPDFRRASPMGKVPALVDGDVGVADSSAIAIYVADRYASGTLAPALDAPERGAWLYWMLYTPGVIEPAMAEKFAGTEPAPTRNGWGSWARMIETLESQVADGPWLLGERFTAADVMVGSSVVFMQLFGMLPESATLQAYGQRCLAREAYQRALAAEPADDG